MGNMKCLQKLKVILVPYPAQGHVTPMLKLASILFHRGFEPVMVTPEFIHHKIMSNMDPKSTAGVSCMPIPDGLGMDATRDFFAIEKAMEDNMPVHLERLVRKFDSEDNGGGGVGCVIVDLLASWAIQVASRCGVPVAGFWPAMLATYRLIAAIPDIVRAGLISNTGIPKLVSPIWFLPNQPFLSTEALPWLIGTPAARKARFRFWTRTLDRSRNLRWLLVNSFPHKCSNDPETPQYDNGHDALSMLKNYSNGQPQVYEVGPLSNHAIVKNPSFWEEDMSCLEWLDKQKPGSVLYISFGSWVSPIGEAEIESLALALEAIGRPFIWVLGPSWREGLPAGYTERVSNQGKIVSWAPQLDVLRHKSVGCCLTHCGWNSTMEAIQCQKPLLCYPIAGDQFVNCAYIVEKWGIGVRIKGFAQEEIKDGLGMVIENDEMKERFKRMHEETMGEEASSVVRSNVAAFVDDIKKLILIEETSYINGLVI